MNATLGRGFGLLLAATVAALLLAIPATAADAPHVLVVEFDNDVNPVTQEFLQDAMERAEREKAAAVVIEMDTPGGLGSSMREIVKSMLALKVPVVVFVAPPGSSADSAGAVIGQAADILAMAPQTNIGSSTPISASGEELGADLRRKVINDAAAYIAELAREHGRNADAAEAMVRQASNYGAREALALVQGREQPDQREARAREVGHRHPGAARRPGPVAAEHQAAGGRDVVEVVSRRVAQRAVLPVPGDRAVDQARVERGQRGVIDAQPRRHAGPEAFEHHVGPACQALDQRARGTASASSTWRQRSPRSLRAPTAFDT